MKSLVIVESPSKAATIQKFLGKDYIVKSSQGHIRDLNEKSLSIRIDNDFEPQYEIPANKKRIIADLKSAVQSTERVFLASDEDREGEAISWHLFQCLDLKKETTKRIAFHEITQTAIQQALENPREIDMNLVNAQQARRVLDRLVGFELSPVLWRKVQPKLSAGRVQSVALRLVVDREREIQAHEKSKYYRIEGRFPLVADAKVVLKAFAEGKYPTKEDAYKLLEQLTDAEYAINNIESKDAIRYPAPPFVTSTLQQEAARKLGFPVSKTMSVAQSLYEKGFITYMRTDSTNLSSLALNTAKTFILENFGNAYYHRRQYRTTSKGAQEAHEAIRPTYLNHPTIVAAPDEQKLYDLIFKRTVASQMADATLKKTDISIANNRNQEIFVSHGTEVLFDGFLKVYAESCDDDNQSQEDQIISTNRALQVGDALSCKQITAEAKFTQAPPRYSEATLVKKLEELGIGRPSTYASIISTLTKGRGYIVKGAKTGEKIEVENLLLKNGVISQSRKTEVVGAEKGKLIPQEIGIVVSDFLVEHFQQILDYGFTASVEGEFDEIAEGTRVWKEVIRSFYYPFHTTVTSATKEEQRADLTREIGNDPETGEMIYLKYGQYGPYLQKGTADKKVYAKLDKNVIEANITIEEALKYFAFPRILGEEDSEQIQVAKGRYGCYIKHGTKSVTLPKGTDPLTITLEEAKSLLHAHKNDIIAVWKEDDIVVKRGPYGPYIAHAKKNYRIPAKTKAETLTKEDCLRIMAQVKK